MPQYRRDRTPGGTYFFTVNLLDRSQSLLTDYISLLRASISRVKESYPFYVDALVVLPEHFHMVLTLPKGSSEYSDIIRFIKSNFSKGMPGSSNITCVSRTKRKEKGIWQRRFWEHRIKDEVDYKRHIDYCYFNPVKHNHVKKVSDWPYSTFHRDVSAGLYRKGWASEGENEGNFGEA